MSGDVAIEHEYNMQKATKVQHKRDGEKFIEFQISNFKRLNDIDAETFARPQ
jgi:hypothetical protein